MLEDKSRFTNRLLGLNKKHEAMAAGYTTHIRADGLIVTTPKRPVRKQRGSLLSNILVAVIAAWAFKIFVLYSLGEATYQQRVDTLSTGNAVEQVGAMLTQIDPVTRAAADLLQAYVP